MTVHVLHNYLRAQRKHSGLSQREIGGLLGYRSQWQVSRHERSRTTPPLPIALAYAVIFQVPVADLFPGLQSTVAHATEKNLAALEKDLQTRALAGRLPVARSQTLQWLHQRQTTR